MVNQMIGLLSMCSVRMDELEKKIRANWSIIQKDDEARLMLLDRLTKTQRSRLRELVGLLESVPDPYIAHTMARMAGFAGLPGGPPAYPTEEA